MKTIINPFEIYAERKMLVVGVIFAVFTAFVSCYSSHLIFGSLKVISNYHQNWSTSIINLCITLISNTIVLFLYARLRYMKTRVVDVLNVVLIAHIAVYIMLYLTVMPLVQSAIQAVELAVLDKGLVAPILATKDTIVLMVFGVFVIGLLIYFFYLLVVGMKIAMNSKSKIDVFFIVLLVVISNTLLQFINPYL